MDDAPTELDLAGLKCPLPALRARKALRGMAPGRRLVVIATDPMATIDIPNLVREEGDTLEGVDRRGAATRFTIRRGAVCLGDSAKAPHS